MTPSLGPVTVHQCPCVLGASSRGWRQAGEWLVHPGWVPKPCPPRQDALCTPARRLLQDSQDVPVTVTPLRAERVLLFDDVLVLLQVGGADRGLGVGPGSGWGEGKGEAGGSKAPPQATGSMERVPQGLVGPSCISRSLFWWLRRGRIGGPGLGWEGGPLEAGTGRGGEVSAGLVGQAAWGHRVCPPRGLVRGTRRTR